MRPKLIEEFGYKNPMEVPSIEKIVLNMGVGESTGDSKKASVAAADLALIAGQKPVITKARKAISQFKVRENMPIGAKVTLRKSRMYEFLDRLVTIALPRVRDFRGLNPKSFDGRGNYARWVSRSTWCSRDQLRQGRAGGAWTSSSPRRRRLTTKPAPCCVTSTSRSGSEAELQTRTLEIEAWLRKSSIEKNKNRRGW